MSLAETQQIMADLKEIMTILNGVQTQTEKIQTETPQIERGMGSRRDAVRAIAQLNQLFVIMGLPKEYNQIISLFQRGIMIAQVLYLSIRMIEQGTMLGRVGGILSMIVVAGSALEGY